MKTLHELTHYQIENSQLIVGGFIIEEGGAV